jgi:uroporphyrin-III C-methyltransferase/precorrin-2 dehydrogenase/sirohydrochlorin ferrochelatase
LDHLPIFMALHGKTALVVGGTPAADQRAGLLARAGASVRRVAAEAVTAADLTDVVLAFVATGNADLDRLVAGWARAARVPVNVVDRPDLCDFIMPAIVDRDGVVAAISTGGASPTLARLLRERVEAALPARIGDLAKFAARFRTAAKGVAHRMRFWERTLDGPIGEMVLAGRAAEAEIAMRASLARGDDGQGVVHIVGAGPGDPELLTLRALRLLQRADVILHDDLVAPAILDYARRDAELVSVGKRKGRHSHKQDEINALIVEHARAGKRVVRLKGGDPFVFGRGGEELEYVRAAGIEAFVVPGITAALGCAAATGIPLTHRDLAQSVTFVTAHGRDGEPDIDWRAAARPGQTTVVYMGLSQAPRVRDRLLAAGIQLSMPVAIVDRGTRPDQRVSIGTVGSLPALAAQHAGGGPALIIIGEVAALASAGLPARLAEAS